MAIAHRSPIKTARQADNSITDIQQYRKKLRYRSWHRGFKELDLLMGRFADQHLDSLDESELALYEGLLDAPDHDVYGWIIGRTAPPREYDHAVLERLQEFRFYE